MPGPVSTNTVKCVVIGDGAVGKVFDNYAVSIEVGGQKLTLHLLDTAGQEDYDRLRPLSYSNANVFLLCFAVSNRISFENVRDKWYPELRRYSPHTPFILVGTQADRRHGGTAGTNGFVSLNEGLKLAREIGAIGYYECSALTREGLRDVFVHAILAALDPKKARASAGMGGKKKRCSIL